MSVLYIDIILLALLVLTALAVNQQRNLFATVMLMAIYSLLCAALFVCLDAVDVAFTEASVGAGIATILFLATLARASYADSEKIKVSWPGLAIVSVCAVLLIYGIADIPGFGVADNPVQTYLDDKYIKASISEIGVPNLVTSVLASYRGYDTLGETTVIFTAGISVLMLLGRGKGKGASIVSGGKS